MWPLLVFSVLLIVLKGALPPRYGPYGSNACKVEQIYIGGYVAGESQYAYLVYPREALQKKTMLPFIAFAHGMTAGGNASSHGTYSSYVQLFQSVCSYGYVVAGPESCPSAYCSNFYEDVITTINTCKSKGTALSPGLSIADFTQIGIYGHSMGGDMTVRTSNFAKQNNIVCGAPLHPSVGNGHSENGTAESVNVEIPLLYFTGSADTVVPPSQVLRSYNFDPIRPKIFAEIDGAAHDEPTGFGKNLEDAYVALWFDCWIKNNATACNNYFFDKNSKDNICTGGTKMRSCMVNGTKT